MNVDEDDQALRLDYYVDELGASPWFVTSFTLEAKRGETTATLKVRPDEVGTGRPLVTAFTIEGLGLDQEAVRSFPILRLAREGLRRATVFSSRGKPVTLAAATEAQKRNFYSEILPKRNAWKGARLTDDQLREVASAYRTMLQFGSRKPTQEIADLTDTPRSTVARWVVEARKRGVLPPAEKGKASAVTDEN